MIASVSALTLQHFCQSLLHHDLTVVHCTILGRALSGNYTLSSIARDCFVSKAAVTGSVDALEKRKLVSRKRSTQDRRLVFVSPTPAGRKLMESVLSHFQSLSVN